MTAQGRSAGELPSDEDRSAPGTHGDGAPALSLEDEKRQLSLDRILRAARVVGVRMGLDMRIDDVAAEAGVSSRTIFRYFGSREQLIKEAFRAGINSYRSRIPRPEVGEDPEAWLRRAVSAFQGLNARIGRLWWDIATKPVSNSDSEVTELFDPSLREEIVQQFLADAWQVYGGEGDPPRPLVAAVWINMSAFTTQILLTDVGCSLDEASELTSDTLHKLLMASTAQAR